jgi:hypothetical protein
VNYSGYEEILKLVTGNLDSHGIYRSLEGGVVPPPAEHLVVTDAWVLFARPRSNNYLLEDLQRLRQSLSEGCAIPGGPAALVTVPSDEPVPFDNIRFRGLSGRGNGWGNGEVKELYFPLPYNGSSRNKRARNPCNLLRYYFLRDFDIFFLVTTST